MEYAIISFLRLNGNTIISFTLATILYRIVQQIQCFVKRKKSLPFPNIKYYVPSPHWFSGNSSHMATLSGHDILASKYADPISGVSTFWGPNAPILSVLKAKYVREIFRYSVHRNKIPVLARHYENLLGEKSLIMMTEKLNWQQNRKLIKPAFLYSSLNRSKERLLAILRRLVDNVNAAIEKQDVEGDVLESTKSVKMDMLQLSKLITLDVFGSCCLGLDFGCTSSSNCKFSKPWISESFDYLIDEMNKRCYQEQLNICTQLYWIPTKRNLKYRRERQKLNDLLLDIVQNARNTIDKNKTSNNEENEEMKNTTLKTIIESRIYSERQISDQFMSEFLITLLFGGYDTTAISIAYTLYNLALRPDLQEQCYLESEKFLDTLGDNATRHLPFTHALVLESLRLFPPVPHTSRNLGRDLKIPELNVTMKAETRVFLSLWCIQRSECNFFRAKEYIPERWVRKDEVSGNWIARDTAENDHATEEEKKSHDYCPAADPSNFFAFSSGGRSCIGAKFAIFEAIVVVAWLVKNFEMIPEENYILIPVKTGLVQMPKHGMPLILKKRKKL